MDDPSFIPARPRDAALVLALNQELFEEDGLTSFPLADRQRALEALLAEPGDWGVIWLIQDGETVVGYTVLTWGFTVEVGGRFVLIDELYLRASHRGRGWGSTALAFIADWAREQGCVALQLEVEHHNQRARAVYARNGFLPHASRTTMELRLPGAASDA